MDLNSISTLAGEQGPVFWAAAAAVSLGLTLLVVALVQAVLRGLSKRRRRRTPTTATAVAPAAPAVSATDDTYVPGPVAAPRPVSPEDGSLAMLLRRLQSAGDRLEEIAGDLESATAFQDGSSLKSEPRAVEYVFRASGS